MQCHIFMSTFNTQTTDLDLLSKLLLKEINHLLTNQIGDITSNAMVNITAILSNSVAKTVQVELIYLWKIKQRKFFFFAEK